MNRPPTTTNESGIPIPSDDPSLTLGPGGPTVLHDAAAVQKMPHFYRERVPERVVHAKGLPNVGPRLGGSVAAGLPGYDAVATASAA